MYLSERLSILTSRELHASVKPGLPKQQCLRLHHWRHTSLRRCQPWRSQHIASGPFNGDLVHPTCAVRASVGDIERDDCGGRNNVCKWTCVDGLCLTAPMQSCQSLVFIERVVTTRSLLTESPVRLLLNLTREPVSSYTRNELASSGYTRYIDTVGPMTLPPNIFYLA